MEPPPPKEEQRPAGEIGADEPPIRRRHITQANRTSSQPTSGATKTTSDMLGDLLRHSLAESSMLERPASFRTSCSWCNGRSHRGPCLAVNLAPRPKSLFVCSASSLSRPDSDEWITFVNSRRASIDTGELGDGNYTSNIRDLALAIDLAEARRVSAAGDQTEQENQLAAAAAAAGVAPASENNNVDGGYAWVILTVIFFINASLLGSHRSYGFIFDKLAREGGQTRTEAAYAFSVMGTIEAMAGPFCGCLLALTGSWRLTIIIGTTLVTLGHLLAAFWAHSQLGSTISMGFISGFGLSFMSISFFQVNKAYFVRYRTIATGVGLSGAAAGTVIITKVSRYLLDNNEGTSMCYLALGAFMLPNIPLALLLRPLSPPKPKVVLPAEVAPSSSSSSSTSSSSMSTSASSLAPSSSSSSSSSAIVPEIDLKPPPPRQQVRDHLSQCKKQQIASSISEKVQEREQQQQEEEEEEEEEEERSKIVSGDQAEGAKLSGGSAWSWIKPVLANPYFHLIWPTQLLFAWLNFIFGMIMIDFGKDRNMDNSHLEYMTSAWTFGQLFGRVCLSCLVDLKYISNKTYTIVCFAGIGAITLALNSTRPEAGFTCPQFYRDIVILALIFSMSMFIALLYILINNLVVDCVQPTTLQPISLGLSSFTGSFFLLPRAKVIGHYRDSYGNYDALLVMLTWVSLLAGLVWFAMPPVCIYLRKLTKSCKWWRTDSDQEGEIVVRNLSTGTKIPFEELLAIKDKRVHFEPSASLAGGIGQTKTMAQLESK